MHALRRARSGHEAGRERATGHHVSAPQGLPSAACARLDAGDPGVRPLCTRQPIRGRVSCCRRFARALVVRGARSAQQPSRSLARAALGRGGRRGGHFRGPQRPRRLGPARRDEVRRRVHDARRELPCGAAPRASQDRGRHGMGRRATFAHGGGRPRRRRGQPPAPHRSRGRRARCASHVHTRARDRGRRARLHRVHVRHHRRSEGHRGHARSARALRRLAVTDLRARAERSLQRAVGARARSVLARRADAACHRRLRPSSRAGGAAGAGAARGLARSPRVRRRRPRCTGHSSPESPCAASSSRRSWRGPPRRGA